MNMHARIMNLRIDDMPQLPLCGGSAATREALAHKVGHRDARHAAAEIAAEGDALVEELAKALEWLLHDPDVCAAIGQADEERLDAVLAKARP